MVTLKDLNEYKYLKREVVDLKKRTNHHEKVADVVTGSSPEPPYTAHSIKIVGCNYYCSTRLYNKYISKLKLLEQKAEEIEDYISTIDDSLVRQITRLRFLDGLSWRAVAFKVGGGNTESSIKVAFHRYIKTRNSCNV